MTPNTSRPNGHCPPMMPATSPISPSPSPNVGTEYSWSRFVDMKDLLNTGAEESRQGDGQRQRRGVPPGFDRVNGLTRHLQRVCEGRLRESPSGPPLAHVVGDHRALVHGVKSTCHPDNVKRA